MFTFRKNGEVLSRVNKDGGLKKVDLKRRRIAESLHAVYVGVMEYVSPNSNKEVPSTQNKPVIKLPNGSMLAMTSNAFYNKLSVTSGEKKHNSYGECLVTEMLLSNGVSFLREMSIAGYNLSEKFMAVKNSLSNSDLALLEKLERAITDFIVFSDDATRPTTLLAINGSKHHAKYDGLWKEFVSSGLAEKLGYTYEVIDTSEYASIKGNEEASAYLTGKVANTLGLPKVTNDEINCFSNQSNRKQAFAFFSSLPDSERRDLLEDLFEEFVNK